MDLMVLLLEAVEDLVELKEMEKIVQDLVLQQKVVAWVVNGKVVMAQMADLVAAVREEQVLEHHLEDLQLEIV
jgi:hypothetical protein